LGYKVPRPSSILPAVATSAATTTSPALKDQYEDLDVLDLIMQRAVQTKLYYLADLRDEPTGKWLKDFLGHEHLDAKGDFTSLGGLNVGWLSYLEQLYRAEPQTVVIELAPPRLSAQQQRNPFLARPPGRSYTETIDPARVAASLAVTVECVSREWVEALKELEQEDTDRARWELGPDPPGLVDAKGRAATVKVAGGEGDDQETPLHGLNVRALRRLLTMEAMQALSSDLGNQVNQHLVADDGDAARDGGGERPGNAVRAAWFEEFVCKWEPRLREGVCDEQRQRLGVVAPGAFKRLGADASSGVDADEAVEALWQRVCPLRDPEDPDYFEPARLAAQLRVLRAAKAAEARAALEALPGRLAELKEAVEATASGEAG